VIGTTSAIASGKNTFVVPVSKRTSVGTANTSLVWPLTAIPEEFRIQAPCPSATIGANVVCDVNFEESTPPSVISAPPTEWGAI
jgi:hypothetical protein